MAASPIIPALAPQADAGSPQAPSTQTAMPVVRTPLHAISHGVGTRSSRRHITPQAGFALEVLGHAVEYLADEYVHAAEGAASLHAADPRVQAMQILMAANREVYFSCPVVKPLSRRLWERLFHRG